MEQLNPSEQSAAPALTRGIRILQLLSQNGPMLLEQISTRLEIPKASALRLLAALEEMQTLRRNADKSYTALYGLRPLVDSGTSFFETLGERMRGLVDSTGCTVEWYEATPDGMQLVRQENPDSELCVQARPGYLRDWETEFEAVTRIAHAFAEPAPELTASHYYKTNGVLAKISRSQIRTFIRTVKEQKFAVDAAFNDNGVRRVAVPAFDEAAHFLGVLAVAQHFRFTGLSETKTLLKKLQNT